MKYPLNRFTHEDSEFIKRIKKVKWVALEGLEIASIQISEKISSWWEKVPILYVFE